MAPELDWELYRNSAKDLGLTVSNVEEVKNPEVDLEAGFERPNISLAEITNEYALIGRGKGIDMQGMAGNMRELLKFILVDEGLEGELVQNATLFGILKSLGSIDKAKFATAFGKKKIFVTAENVPDSEEYVVVKPDAAGNSFKEYLEKSGVLLPPDKRIVPHTAFDGNDYLVNASAFDSDAWDYIRPEGKNFPFLKGATKDQYESRTFSHDFFMREEVFYGAPELRLKVNKKLYDTLKDVADLSLLHYNGYDSVIFDASPSRTVDSQGQRSLILNFNETAEETKKFLINELGLTLYEDPYEGIVKQRFDPLFERNEGDVDNIKSTRGDSNAFADKAKAVGRLVEIPYGYTIQPKLKKDYPYLLELVYDLANSGFSYDKIIRDKAVIVFSELKSGVLRDGVNLRLPDDFTRVKRKELLKEWQKAIEGYGVEPINHDGVFTKISEEYGSKILPQDLEYLESPEKIDTLDEVKRFYEIISVDVPRWMGILRLVKPDSISLTRSKDFGPLMAKLRVWSKPATVAEFKAKKDSLEARELHTRLYSEFVHEFTVSVQEDLVPLLWKPELMETTDIAKRCLKVLKTDLPKLETKLAAISRDDLETDEMKQGYDNVSAALPEWKANTSEAEKVAQRLEIEESLTQRGLEDVNRVNMYKDIVNNPSRYNVPNTKPDFGDRLKRALEAHPDFKNTALTPAFRDIIQELFEARLQMYIDFNDSTDPDAGKIFASQEGAFNGVLGKIRLTLGFPDTELESFKEWYKNETAKLNDYSIIPPELEKRGVDSENKHKAYFVIVSRTPGKNTAFVETLIANATMLGLSKKNKIPKFVDAITAESFAPGKINNTAVKEVNKALEDNLGTFGKGTDEEKAISSVYDAIQTLYEL